MLFGDVFRGRRKFCTLANTAILDDFVLWALTISFQKLFLTFVSSFAVWMVVVVKFIVLM